MLTRALIVTRGAAVGEMALAGLGPDGDECHKLLGIEKQRIERALDAAGWHRGKACDSQGITRPTLRRKMRAFGLERTRSGMTIGD